MDGQKVIMNTYNRFPLVLVKGEGSYVYDDSGKKYLDFVAGIAVNTLGHGNSKLASAIAEQAKTLIHVSNLYWTQPQVELAEKLVANSSFDKVFYCNSGAEAVEGALKLSRKYADKYHQGRFEIITMKNSFHGRTFGAVTATGQTKYQKGLAPLLPGIKHSELNNFPELLENINDNTCAILIEPLQGEGGIKSATKEYLEKVRKLCDEKDILLVFDEVQCGMGRTGRLFAHQHYGVCPDVIALAKGAAGGVPIGILMATDKAATGFEPGDHASTFGGNPLATAAANVVFDELMNGLLDNVVQQGKLLAQKLNQLKESLSMIVDVRGVGLIQGIELDQPVGPYVTKAMEKGLLLVNAGVNVIRFVPPLNVSEAEVNQCVEILAEVLKS